MKSLKFKGDIIEVGDYVMLDYSKFSLNAKENIGFQKLKDICSSPKRICGISVHGSRPMEKNIVFRVNTGIDNQNYYSEISYNKVTQIIKNYCILNMFNDDKTKQKVKKKIKKEAM